MGAKKGGSKFYVLPQSWKNRGQKSICGHKKGGQYSMSHWKIGVKILCSKSWEGRNSMKAKIWGSKFYFFLVEPLVKILCSLKRGVKILYFFPVPWKRGVKTAEPTNQLHWRGAPPGFVTHFQNLPHCNIMSSVKAPLIPNKHAITCLNWARKGPMLRASARFWPS